MADDSSPILTRTQGLHKGSFRLALIRELQRGNNSKGRTLERIARRLITMAEAGDMAAIKEVMQRVDGAVSTAAGDTVGATNIGQLVIQWRDPQQQVIGDTVTIESTPVTVSLDQSLAGDGGDSVQAIQGQDNGRQ